MSPRLALLAAGSLLALAGPAFAQSAAVEELIVTAQKREQPAFEVPIALTALSGRRLEELRVRDLSELSVYTPGLRVQDQSPNNPGYVIRGITSDNSNVNQEPRVSIFQDGVSISKAQASYSELFDIDRVEVARGPQTTLFGRAALIGGVNIIQRKAVLGRTEGYVHGEVGDYGQRVGEGAANLPLGDVAALRVSGRVRQRHGYVDNALGGKALQSVDTGAVRAALKFQPDARLNADLIVNYEEDHPTGTAFKSIRYSPTDPLTGQVLASRAAQDPAAISAPAAFLHGKGLGVDRAVGGATALVDYKLNDAWTLHSVSAFRRFDAKEVLDADGVSLPILSILVASHGHELSQELRLNYDDGGRLRGFAGFNVLRSKNRQNVPLQFDERISLADLTGTLNGGPFLGLPASTPAPLALFGNTAFTGALVQALAAQLSGGAAMLSAAQAQAIAANLRAAHVEQAQVNSDVRAQDLFADVSFDVTEQFELSAGLRYSHEKAATGYGASVGDRSALGGLIAAAQLAGAGSPLGAAILGALQSPFYQQIPASQLPLFGLTDQPTTNNGDVTAGSLSDSGLAWRLVGRYEVSKDANLYASYARGRRPPVQDVSIPSFPGDVTGFAEVPAETVDSFEVGGKFAFLQRRLLADIAVFDYEYDNFQTVEQRGTQFFTTNAGKARAYGLEAQVGWRVTPDFDLNGTYAYNHGRFRSGAYKGNHFRLSPDQALSLTADWRVPAFGGVVQVQPSYNWQSKVFFADNNDRPALQQPPATLVADNIQDEVQKGFGLANLRVSWTQTGGRLVLEAFATNLFEKKYIIDAGNTGDDLGLATYIAGRPRMVGAGVTYRFN
jgi:iron complex outermembrane receptor protein